MPEPDRIQDFLRRLTPLSRNNLLTELERLEACGSALPGCATVVEKLRTEFRKDGQPHRLDNPVRYFFAPLEPLLVDGAPEHANSGRILRGSLSPIWEWISRNLLPTMARDYVNEMNRLIAADNLREAGRVSATFQTKVVKSLEGTRRPGEVQRRAASLDPQIRRPAGYQDIGIAGRVREETCRCAALRAGVGGYTAQDSLAIDPSRHQGCAEQERCRYRCDALCDHGLDGAGPHGRQPIGFARQLEERADPGRQEYSDGDVRHRIRTTSPHRSVRRIRLGQASAEFDERGRCAGGSGGEPLSR